MTNMSQLRIALLVILGILGLYFLSPIMTPFFLGALLAYLGDPLVGFLSSKHVPRTIGVMLVFIFVLLLLAVVVLLLIPLIEDQIAYIVQKIPDILAWSQNALLPWLNAHIYTNESLNLASIKKQIALHSDKAKNFASHMVTVLTHSTFAMIDFVMNCILVPVVAFYLMRDWPKILQKIQRYLPESQQYLVNIARECDEVVGAFFKGQLLVMLALAVYYSVGLEFISLKVAIFVGVLSGLLTIVPYLGFAIGIVVASLTMYFETYTFLQVIYVWIIYGIGQALESMVLTPLLVGDKLGLHPVAVIFAVLAGGTLFGFLGVLLALPVAAMILVILKRMMPHAARA